MHVGVGAVVVGKDKAARVGREEEEEGKKKSPPEAYQSVLNCFIITEMHRRNFLLKIMQSLISLHSLKAVASLPHFSVSRMHRLNLFLYPSVWCRVKHSVA